MRHAFRCIRMIGGLGLLALTAHTGAGNEMTAENSAPAKPAASAITQLMQDGKETVRIICFGDSITGVYYHSGGARAWCDMLGIGLQRLYQQAKLEMINAGISSQNTRQALQRIQKDVLDRKPTLVISAFGMNDIRGTNPVPTQESYSNQTQIVKLCKGAGAEVVLCTLTSVYHGYPDWPFERLAPYAEMVRKVGAEEKAPVADMFRTFEDMRAKDPSVWMLTMSEWIHPDMNGHKVIAETIIRTITGKSISLANVPAPVPGIPFTLMKIAKGKPVKVVAMEPYDKMIAAALREINSNAQVEVSTWIVPPQSIAGIAASAKKVRGQKPDLVIVAIPTTASDPTEEWYIRHYSETYNGAISYERRTFDCIGILPSAGTPELGPVEIHQQDLARAIIRGHDLDPIERKAGDAATPEQILQRWLHQQAALKSLPPETAK